MIDIQDLDILASWLTDERYLIEKLQHTNKFKAIYLDNSALTTADLDDAKTLQKYTDLLKQILINKFIKNNLIKR